HRVRRVERARHAERQAAARVVAVRGVVRFPRLQAGRRERQLRGSLLVAAVLRHFWHVRPRPDAAQVGLAVGQTRRGFRWRLLRGSPARQRKNDDEKRALHVSAPFATRSAKASRSFRSAAAANSSRGTWPHHLPITIVATPLPIRFVTAIA